MKTPRQLALNWLGQVVSRGRSVNEILAKDTSELEAKHKSLAKQMLFGCLRYYHQLKTIADTLLEKPLKAKDDELMLVIVLGLYQLKYLSTPDHAAISESVELTRTTGKKWAAGLVNGVLRHYQREAVQIEQDLAKSIQFQYSHPGWIVKKLKQDWDDESQQILEQANQQAPMILRVNTQKNSRDVYLANLKQAEIDALPHNIAPDGIVLANALDVMALPGFIQGEVTIQDAAAQLPVELLDLQAGQTVLDACAAPGGKTTHILQRQKDVDLTAVEMSSTRAEKIKQTLERLDFNCQLFIADVVDTDNWWDGELFDRILLDVPCSASGVIRRNPDIKIHRKVTDIKPLLEIQKNILARCWQLLKPGGILVYATCSVFKDENESQIKAFVSQQQAELLKLPDRLDALLSKRAAVGYQILPGEAQMDGFYFCGLRKPLNQ